MDEMRWRRSNRAEAAAVAIADRHYNRQKVGSAQFVPPGGCAVLITPEADALWVTSTPFAQFVQHAWAGAWMNTLFRNESMHLSSELIVEALAASRHLLGEPPPLGIVSFIDASKIRKKRDPGRCYRRAGWSHVGFTKKGLYAFQLLPEDWPAAAAPVMAQERLESIGG